MFINRLNQLYKPKRILYYIDAENVDIALFGKGKTDERISKYSNAFGVYDYPGLFYVDSLNKPVIGIEFRIDDERIDYPKNLSSVVLDEAFYYSIEVDSDTDVDVNKLKELFACISKDDDAHRQYDDLSICENPRVISVFYHDEKYRILYEWKLDEDRAIDVINDNFEKFDKEMLYKTSFFDPITGHYNWNHLVPFLEMPMDAGIRDYAFAHFDIKEFRIINEVYGHIAGNNVLSKVVKAMNDSDFVYTSARCHNDNFAMIIRDMPNEELIKKLEEFFDNLSHLDEDPDYKICYRCGVVPMPRSLLFGNRVADAGKLAQKMGTTTNRTDIVIYTDEMHDDILWGNYIKAYVDSAVKNDEFLVYLQPKFDIETEKIKGAEALIRWNYKHRTLLAPYKFIPYFEKDGTIAKIDDIVLRKVCEALAGWKKEGKPLYPISVNLSRTRMYDEGLVDYLESIVDSYGVDHSYIDFELTESATYDDTEQMINVLLKLREKHFELSMDDFGTGYSSLSLLTQMPMDTLKIDKSFVDKVGTENDRKSDIAVIRHIISLAKELGFVCLAEGAEEKKQVERLKELGCDIIQGYYFSKPIPLKEYESNYLNPYEVSPACEEDRSELIALYRSQVGAQGCPWSEEYPSNETIDFDLSRDSLFVLKHKGKIIAAASIEEDEEVDKLECWNKDLEPEGEFARICVNPEYKKKGIGRMILRHIEEEIKRRGYKGIHIIVNKKNLNALRLYDSFGYINVGECFMYEQDFWCYEKKL